MNTIEKDTDFDQADIENLIVELETDTEEVQVYEEPAKPSFIQTLVTAWNYKQPTLFKSRFQKLAGIDIDKIKPVAQLTIGDKIIPMDKVSHWYDIIRYKLCGFNYEIFKK